jgi:hypothetical protein
MVPRSLRGKDNASCSHRLAYAPLAQWTLRLTTNQEITGSNPVGRTEKEAYEYYIPAADDGGPPSAQLITEQLDRYNAHQHGRVV